jgi:hypothetical protein
MDLFDHFPKLRKFENLHILLWLVKDSCWMLELKILGSIMILPTLSVAVWITWMTRTGKEVFINLAVFFWILANSFWMIMEFFYKESYKIYAAFPFSLGFVCVFIYYFRYYSEKTQKAD